MSSKEVEVEGLLVVVIGEEEVEEKREQGRARERRVSSSFTLMFSALTRL